MRESALQACVLFLRPIASVLLRFGISWKEFSEVSKRVFVQVATDEYGLRGRPTNASRVSIMTGVNRKEVTKIRNRKLDLDIAEILKYSTVGRLISGWHQDADFCDSKNKPLVLSRTGNFPSFIDLNKRYGRDISYQAVLKELIASKSVVELEDGRLQIVKHNYAPVNEGDNSLQNFCIALADYAHTMRHNYAHRDTENLRLSGDAKKKEFPVELAEQFRNFSAKKGSKFLEDINNWLELHMPDQEELENIETMRLGAGAYVIYDDTESEYN